MTFSETHSPTTCSFKFALKRKCIKEIDTRNSCKLKSSNEKRSRYNSFIFASFAGSYQSYVNTNFIDTSLNEPASESAVYQTPTEDSKEHIDASSNAIEESLSHRGNCQAIIQVALPV